MKFNFKKLYAVIVQMNSDISGFGDETEVEVEVTQGNVSNDAIVDSLTLTATVVDVANTWHEDRHITKIMEVFAECENKRPIMTTTIREEIKTKR